MVQPVNDATMNRQFSLLCIAMALALLPFNRPSIAADLPVKARAFPSVFDWTGFYLGGHVGLRRRRFWSWHQSASRSTASFFPIA